MQQRPRGKQTLRSSIRAAIAGWAIFAAPAGAGEPPNLLGDPGFDLSKEAAVFPQSGFWIDDHIGQAGAILDPVEPMSGLYTLHLHTGAAGGDYRTSPRQVDIPSEPGRRYHAGGLIRTRPEHFWLNGSESYFRVGFFDDAGQELVHYDTLKYLVNHGSYRLYELVTPAAPEGTAAVRFTIYLTKVDGLAGQSIVVVENVFLTESVLFVDGFESGDTSAWL